jgi:hypothetical protein
MQSRERLAFHPITDSLLTPDDFVNQSSGEQHVSLADLQLEECLYITLTSEVPVQLRLRSHRANSVDTQD